jgi:hypothetical protein
MKHAGKHIAQLFKGRTVAALSGILLILAGCNKENRFDFFKRTGAMVLQTRVVAPFTDIVVGNNKVNVYITQDSVFDVKVQAGEHLVDLVTTEVRDNKLYIENRNTCNFMRSYKFPINVFIHMPRLWHIFHDGSGTIQSTNTLVGDTIDIITKSAGNVDLRVNCYRASTHMHSSADILLSGTCQDNICFATGNGFLYSQELASGYCWVYGKTSGEIYVNVSGLLQVEVASIGDVYYRGNPAAVQEVHTGTGLLIAQ